jgi:hypothetical protein
MAFGCESWKLFNMQFDLPNPRTIFGVGGADAIAIDYANPNEKPGSVKTGYYLGKNQVVFNMLDIVNYKKEDQQIYECIDVDYLEGKPMDRLDVVQFSFDPFVCSSGKNGQYTGIAINRPTPDTKKWTVNAEGLSVKRDGYLVSMRGHLHDGGEKIVMKVNGKEVCNSKVLYGGPEHTTIGPDGKKWETIREMTNCLICNRGKEGR